MKYMEIAYCPKCDSILVFGDKPNTLYCTKCELELVDER